METIDDSEVMDVELESQPTMGSTSNEQENRIFVRYFLVSNKLLWYFSEM